MKKYYDKVISEGYAKAIEEIKKFAELTASLLGRDAAGMDEAARVELYHALLCEHPYAYPLALELSLYLPPRAAIDWLHDIWRAYYNEEGKIDATRVEIDSFLLFRMKREEAFQSALRCIARDKLIQPSVEIYLREEHPELYSYYRKRMDMDNGGNAVSQKIDEVIRFCFKAAKGVLFAIKRKKIIPYRFTVFYLKHSSRKSEASNSFFTKFFVWAIMRMYATNIRCLHDIEIKPNLMELPVQSVACTNGKNSDKKLKINICTTVWGSEYVRMFLNYNLPSVLARNNLPKLAENAQVCFCIYTTRSGYEEIVASSQFRDLNNAAEVRFFFVEKILSHVSYNIMCDSNKAIPMVIMYNHFWRMTALEGKYAIYNFPDGSLQNDLYSFLLDKIKEGKESVYLHPAGPHFIKERVTPVLDSMRSSGILNLSNVEICNLAREYSHPSNSMFYIGSRQRYFGPSLFFCEAGNEGFVCHMSCIQPYVQKPSMDIPWLAGTVDHFVTLTPMSDPAKIYICTDIREACVLSLEPERGQDDMAKFGEFTRKEYAYGLRANMKLFNRIFLNISVRYPRVDVLSDDVWMQAEKKSKAYARSVLGFPVLNNTPPLEFFFNEKFFDRTWQ